MAIVRYEPPDSDATPPAEGIRTVGRFFSNPIGTLIGLAQGGKGQPALYFPVEVDTETGRVSIEVPGISGPPGKKRNPAHLGVAFPDPAFVETNRVRFKLEEAFRTGIVSPGLGPYREIAELVAKLPHDVAQPDPEAFSVFEREPDTAPDESVSSGSGPISQYEEIAMAGYLPPGGLAGFAQMAPASKVALTQGVRRSGGTRKRARRKLGRPRKRGRPRTVGKRARKKLVKGSAAAKRRMAALRRLRK